MQRFREVGEHLRNTIVHRICNTGFAELCMKRTFLFPLDPTIDLYRSLTGYFNGIELLEP